MHIVFTVLAILGGIAIWYSRLKALGGMANDAGRVAQRVRNAPRKYAFKRRAGQTGLKAVDDPREAATILMVLVAGAYADQPLETAYRKTIEREIMSAFDFSLKEADEMITLALWRVQEVDFPTAVSKRMSKLIANEPSLGEKEILDLETMLSAVLKSSWSGHDQGEEIMRIYRYQVGLIPESQ